MEFGDAIKQIKTRGDVAVVLIAGTAGFMLDAALNVFGFLSPGLAGGACATGALGLKVAIEELIEKGKNKRELLKKSDSIIKFLDKDKHEKIIKRIGDDKKYFLEEIISEEEFQKTLNNVIKEYLREQ